MSDQRGFVSADQFDPDPYAQSEGGGTLSWHVPAWLGEIATDQHPADYPIICFKRVENMVPFYLRKTANWRISLLRELKPAGHLFNP